MQESGKGCQSYESKEQLTLVYDAKILSNPPQKGKCIRNVL
jgi:hypothetical protein